MKQSLFARLFSAQDCRVANAPRNDERKKGTPRNDERKKGTPCNDERKSVQYGRSMIEMLGVLAIIGVLSVGGIAGYTKAMEQYKINKMLSYASQISQDIRALYYAQKNYSGLSSLSVAYTLGVVPEDLKSGKHFWGGTMRIYAERSCMSCSDSNAFVMGFYDLPKEPCIALATQFFGSQFSSGLESVGINPTGFITPINCSGGIQQSGGTLGTGYVYACANGAVVSLPLSPALASRFCQPKNNRVFYKFR